VSYKFLMKQGNRGQEVARLQNALCIDSDGIFGSKTKEAVQAYQKAQGLAVDGIAGPDTLSRLDIPVQMGIDVSKWNKSPNWDKVVEDGVKFAYVKMSEGRTYVSERKGEIDSARCAGLAVGAYHFARPDTDPSGHDAVAEAHHFLETYNARPNDMRPVLDMEKGLKQDDNYNLEWAWKFCDIVEANLGKRPIIYTARWYVQAYFENGDPDLVARLGTEDLWWAEYDDEQSKKLAPWNEWLMWQFTGSGTINGVEGNCDVNWCAGGRMKDLF
jgi:lysozyme